MGFIRRQQERMAVRFLAWQYERMNLQIPETLDLERQAGKLVKDAHRIARELGRNMLVILKELVSNLKK